MKNYLDNFGEFSLNEGESVEGVMPPGKYWIGDLCYVMSNKWEAFCEETIKGDEVLSGKFNVGGIEVVSMRTAYGDGEYTDTKGRKYPVDAGLIGAIRVQDITDPKAYIEYGNVVSFDSPWRFEDESGVLIFGNVIINTKDEEDEEEDDFDYYEDEDDEEDGWS